MGTAFYSIGILCLLYYIVIIAYTKNWKATFSGFWLIFGAVQFLIGAGVDRLPEWCMFIVQIIFTVMFLIFMAVEIIILSGMLTMSKKELPVIIVLGACIRGGRITGSLKKRLDKALAYLNANPETIAIVSGGQGRGEDMTESFAMKQYLLQCGVEEERIIMEDKSRSTKENLENSLLYLKNKKEAVGIVTNNFHMYRAVKMAKYTGYEKIRAVTASSDPVLFLNYMVREFFAVLYMYVKFGRKTRKEQIDK